MPSGDEFDEATTESTMQHILPVSGITAPRKRAVTNRETLSGRINKRQQGNRKPGRPPNEKVTRLPPEQWKTLACAPPTNSTTAAGVTAAPARALPTATPGPCNDHDITVQGDEFLGIPMLQRMALPSSAQKTPTFSINDLSPSPSTTPYPAFSPNIQFPGAQWGEPLNRVGAYQLDHPASFKPEMRFTTMKAYTDLTNGTTFEADTIVMCNGRRPAIEEWLADEVCAVRRDATGPNGRETLATFTVEVDGRRKYLLEAIPVVPNSGTQGPNGPVGLYLSPEVFTQMFVHEGHRCPPGQPVVPPLMQRPSATTHGLYPGSAQSSSGLGDNDPPLQGQPMNPMNQGEYEYNNNDYHSTIR